MALYAVPYKRRPGERDMEAGVVLLEAPTFTDAERTASYMWGGSPAVIGDAVEVDVSYGKQIVEVVRG